MKLKKLALVAGAVISTAGAAGLLESCGGTGHGGQANEKPWSFIQIGDLHAGLVLYGPSWTNTVNTILTSNNAWNLKIIVSPGDLYEQRTNVFPFTAEAPGRVCGMSLTGSIWKIKSAGISFMAVPGNHDSDDDIIDPAGQTNIIHWNSVFGTNFYEHDPYWFSNRVPGDTRDVAFKITNGTSKMLFIGLRWLDRPGTDPVFQNTQQVFTAYATNCAWASNLAAQYPDHHVIVAMHYFMDTNGTPSTKDLPQDPDDPNLPRISYINEGPGIVAWDALKSAPNLLMILSGHVRAHLMVRSHLTANDGHGVESIKYNTQSVQDTMRTNLNGGTFVLYTVYPSAGYIWGRIYNSDLHRFLTNGEFNDLGFINDWKFSLSGF
jgi:hypothetical protein